MLGSAFRALNLALRASAAAVAAAFELELTFVVVDIVV